MAIARRPVPADSNDNLTVSAKTLRRLMGSDEVSAPLPDSKSPLWDWAARLVAQRKAGDAPKVEVLNDETSAQGWLMVVADDQPFLTDTISLAVRRHNPDLAGVWHPVLAVGRNAAAKGLLEGAEAARGTSRKPLEAWILVQIQGLNVADVKAMVQDVKESLVLARAAVRDFDKLRGKMEALAGGLPKGEEKSFLGWLADGHMILLGYRHYDYRTARGKRTVQATAGSGLGILAESGSAVEQAKPVEDVGTLGHYVAEEDTVILSKTPEMSRVHRAASMDYVAVLERDGQGEVVGEHRFIGLYTSSAYTAGVQSIPLVRAKLAAVVKLANWPQDSLNARNLMNVLEMWPRDELFLSDVATLKRLAVATVAAHERPGVTVLVRASAREQAATVLVYLPLARMSMRIRERIGTVLADKLGTPVREFKVELGSGELARMVVRVVWKDGMVADAAHLTQAVREVVRGWDDEVQDAMVAAYGPTLGIARLRAFAALTDVAYRNTTSAEVSVADAAFVAGKESQQVRLEISDGLRVRMLKRGGTWPLAELMPLVDSCGLAAITEDTHELGDVWVHDVLCQMPEKPLTPDTEAALVAVVDACLRGTLEEDSLNRLALGAGMGVRAIGVWRAWVAYLQQIDRRLDSRNVRIAVRNRPELAKMLWDIFEALHNPAVAAAKRQRIARPLIEAMEKEISAMPTAELERVWRTALGVVLAILRTNVWQPMREERGEALAFKMDCSKLYGLPEPKPWREIAVYHPEVEGIHLRGGPVARGGLRHSDRGSDYRTEVLGLMTAQMRKNTIIVPVGAKGGFFVRKQLAPKEAYKLYIRALLSVTDTYDAKGNVIAPRGVVRLDGNDPYLVVAADKGTAKYSDTANGEAIAADYWDGVTGGFWMGDAFASGGSKGYDHKAMGITAKGAWVSVAHHLAALNLTPSAQRPVTIVGVGDMAGDVFGNGLLRDAHVQLIAAFNHIHIFLDPNPDPAKSFKERQRMFDASLGWDGYDTKLISKGGGVFLRTAKRIELSPAVQASLGIKAPSLTPDELIRAILKAPVDVIWNGGIGTYIKASDEPQSAAADKANDDVRVDATQVRAKVIGEGGNLGITSRGRVELARRGVQLNTDALDNSAGVDTSDHEVNVKILLQLVMRDGKLDENGRVKLLESMTDEIGAQVLRDNAHQNLVISLDAAEDEAYHAELHAWQEHLVDANLADPIVDCLPSLRDLKSRTPAAYTRPELCALLAGTKAWLRQEIEKDTELLGSALLRPLLKWYFPPALQAKYDGVMDRHALAHPIIATMLANLIVNRLGILAVPRMMGDFEASARDAVRALSVGIVVGGMNSMWRQMDALEGLNYKAVVSVSQRLKLVSTVLAAWVLRRGQPVDAHMWTQVLQVPIQEILALLPKVLKGRAEVARWEEEWIGMGLPAAMAARMTLLSPLVVAPDVAMMSKEQKKSLPDVLVTHLRVGEALKLPALVKKVRGMVVDDAWTRQAVQSMGQELFSRQAAITKKLLASGQSIESWLAGCEGSLERYNSLVKEIVREKNLSVAMLSVLLGRLRELEG